MASQPVVIATWRFGEAACRAGAEVLAAGGSVLDAVERAANVVEEDPTVHSVGYGGLPNAEGVVELDAAIMDGPTHRAGAVAGLTGIRKPISGARRVMERTPHVMLVGQNARRFALREGFPDAELLTDESRQRWYAWRGEQIAPEAAHFFETLLPEDKKREPDTHDTVGICALDANGNLAVGCTTSGLAWKLPGRVGDSPIIGSGLYVDNAVGAAAATGNGDEIINVCLSYRVVMGMERGLSPQAACEEAIRYLLAKRPGHRGSQPRYWSKGLGRNSGAACIALDKEGRMGAAATREGFHLPDRLWIYAFTRDGEVVVEEGVYVDG